MHCFWTYALVPTKLHVDLVLLMLLLPNGSTAKCSLTSHPHSILQSNSWSNFAHNVFIGLERSLEDMQIKCDDILLDRWAEHMESNGALMCKLFWLWFYHFAIDSVWESPQPAMCGYYTITKSSVIWLVLPPFCYYPRKIKPWRIAIHESIVSCQPTSRSR